MCGIMGYFRKGAGNDERLGAFCCLTVTATEMGLVKDAYAFKPLVVAETNDFVAVATKEIAIRCAIPGITSIGSPGGGGAACALPAALAITVAA